MSKRLGGILVLLVGAGLMLYSMSRTFHLLSATLPPGQEILAAVALLGFDLGMVAWLLTFLKGAEGGWQRAIAGFMVVVDLIAVCAGTLGDTLLVSGESGLLAALDQGSRQTIVVATVIFIVSNICAVVFFHMTSPDNLRHMAEESARSKIQEQSLQAISEQANLLAAQLAPVIAANWVTQMQADFLAPLSDTDVSHLLKAPAKSTTEKPGLLKSFFKKPATVADDDMATMASDSPEVETTPARKGRPPKKS